MSMDEALVARPALLNWRRSSASSGGASTNCVEIAKQHNQFLVRDSKNITGPILGFTPTQWTAFMSGCTAKPKRN